MIRCDLSKMRFMRSGTYIKNTKIISILFFIFGSIIFANIFVIFILDDANRDLRLIRVTSISVEGTPVKGENCTISLNGYLVNSCQRIHHHEKDIYEQDKLVNITLWGYFQGELCAESLRPFQYNISIIFPSSGNWTIGCNGISESIIVLD